MGGSMPNEDAVRELAYYKWAAAGYPPSDGVSFWLEAENELADKPAKKATKVAAKQVPKPEKVRK